MEYRQLGNTDINASVLGFGMWPIGGTQHAGDYGTVSTDEAVDAIRGALDLGVTLFDAAPAYGNGHAEVVLGAALGSRRDEAVVVTKCAVHWDYDADSWVTTSNHDDIVRSAEDSLRRIGTDRLDVLLIHVPDPDGSPEGSMAAFGELVASGKVGAVGVSNFTVEQLDEYRLHGLIQVQQVGYNMLDRRAEAAMIPRCAELGVGLMTYGALCHGLFSGVWDEEMVIPAEDWRSKGDVFGLPLFAGDNLRHNIRVATRLAAFAATPRVDAPATGDCLGDTEQPRLDRSRRDAYARRGRGECPSRRQATGRRRPRCRRRDPCGRSRNLGKRPLRGQRALAGTMIARGMNDHGRDTCGQWAEASSVVDAAPYRWRRS